MSKRRVWIVEASWRGDTDDDAWGPWHPTVGIGLTRAVGRGAVRRWRQNNPDDRFRLRKYTPPGTF